MFEKTNYQETAATSVRPMPASNATVVKSADISESSLTKVRNDKIAPESSAKRVTVIGTDVVFKGDLISGDDIFIHGTVEGTIARHTKHVIVGAEGRVRALIHATTVTVQGQVNGDIYGDELVELLDGAKVNGNIFCPCIKVDEGAKLNGTVSMA